MATRNYVPRANGEGSIGTEKKHWGGAFFDKLAVKTLEVIGGGAENDAQPATVGWVKQSLQSIFTDLLTKTGFTANFATNGYLVFGEMFGGLKIQWGLVTPAIKTTPADTSVRHIALPIEFRDSNFSVMIWDSATDNNSLRVYKACPIGRAKFEIKVVTFDNGVVKVTPDDFGMNFIAIGR